MQAAILRGPNDLSVGAWPDPVAGAGDMVLRVAAATICGTDIRILRGRKTAGVRYPSILGHEFVGTIADGGGHAGMATGMRVAVCPSVPCGRCTLCWAGREPLCAHGAAIGYEIDGAFAEFIRIPARAVEMGNVHLLPDSLGDREAVLIEPLACVLNGQNRARVGPGESVVVLGSGPIGILHAKLARLRGAAQVIVSEHNANRRAAAIAAGADAAIDLRAEPLAARVQALTGGNGADVVVCAIGNPSLVGEAAVLAAPGGRISLFAGCSPGETAQMDVNAIHYAELEVHGAFGLSRRDFATALGLVLRGRIDLSDMVTHTFPLAEAAAAFAMAEGRAAVKVAIVPD